MHNERSTFASNFFRRFFAHLSFLVPLAGGMHQHGRRRGVNTPWKRRKNIRTTLKNKAVFFHLLNCAASRIYAGWKKGRPVKPVKPFSLSRKNKAGRSKELFIWPEACLARSILFRPSRRIALVYQSLCCCRTMADRLYYEKKYGRVTPEARFLNILRSAFFRHPGHLLGTS